MASSKIPKYITITEECPICKKEVKYTRLTTHRVRCCDKCWWKIKKLIKEMEVDEDGEK